MSASCSWSKRPVSARQLVLRRLIGRSWISMDARAWLLRAAVAMSDLHLSPALLLCQPTCLVVPPVFLCTVAQQTATKDLQQAGTAAALQNPQVMQEMDTSLARDHRFQGTRVRAQSPKVRTQALASTTEALTWTWAISWLEASQSSLQVHIKPK